MFIPSSPRAMLRAATACAALLAPCVVSAQEAPDETAEPPVDLGTIILNTTRGDLGPLDVPANISVIDADTLNGRNITDLKQLSRTVPGVTVTTNVSGASPFNTHRGAQIRGVSGNRVQMQVDGSRVAETIVDGTRDYVDLSFTKQAEIVRGPASVLWGADALGGVVSIETLDPEDILDGRDRGADLRLSYGSLDNSMTGSVAIAQKLSPSLDVLFGYTQTHSNEVELSNARADGGIYTCTRDVALGATPCNEFDPTDRTTKRGLFKAVWTPDSRHRLEFSADVMERDIDVDYNQTRSATVHSYDRNMKLSRNRYALEHVFTPDTGVFDQVKTVLAYTPHQSDRTGIETKTSGTDLIVERDELFYSEDFFEVDIQADASFDIGGTSHELTFGFDGDFAKTDYFRRDIVNNVTQGTIVETRAGGFNFANANTTRADFYVQDRITMADGNFELTPGLRFATYKLDPRPNSDYVSIPGSEPTERSDERVLASLGAMYHLNDTYSVWGKYGQGFKMPTAQQLFTSRDLGGFVLVPAPDLVPEEVESYEIGLRGQFDRGFFSVTAFHADYTNFIKSFHFVPNTSPTQITYTNLPSVQTWGIEASGAWEFSDTLRGHATASWQKGTQKSSSTSASTPHTLPPLTAVFSIEKELPQWDLTLEAVTTLAAGVKETSDPDGFKPKGYGLLDLHAQWEVIDNGFLNVSVNNAFDKRYFGAGAAGLDTSPSQSVQNNVPIELFTGPGRTFSVSFEMKL